MRSARSEWMRLKGKRRGLENRWEKYASFTLPRLYTAETWNEDADELAHDWQSVGAQAVNHVVNKLMLALFAPSRPFMRLQLDPTWVQRKLGPDADMTQFDAVLAQAELDGAKQMDNVPGTRAKLYLAIANLVALGNVCMYLPKEANKPPRIFNVAQYVIRRTGDGSLKQVIIKECMAFDELEPNVQVEVSAKAARYQHDTKVEYFRQITRNNKGGYELSQYVDEVKLGEAFDGAWANEDKLPWRFLTWNLKDGNNYGTGLVEDYAADFAGLSTLSQAQITGAVLASEFRWLVNPSGLTNVEDFRRSENGAAIPGSKDDISLVANSKPGDLQVVSSVVADFIQRIGRGFLLSSAVTRQAERVTAEEIRLQAQELETSFGGTYSSIAVGLQLPLAVWLLRGANLEVQGTEIKITIITGLDALSRSGDLDNLRAAMGDMANLTAIRQVAPEIDWRAITVAIFTGHGLPTTKFLRKPEDVAAEQAQQQQDAINAQAAADAASTGVANANAQGTQQ